MRVDGTALKALALSLETLDDLPQHVQQEQRDTITSANFSFNAIASGLTLQSLHIFPNLVELILDNNELTSLTGLPPMHKLMTLWLNNNSIQNLDELLDELSTHCPRLEYLSLLGNPCCPHELAGRLVTEYRRYRVYTAYRLPSLKRLDASPLSEEELTEARDKGRFLRNHHHHGTTTPPLGGGGSSTTKHQPHHHPSTSASNTTKRNNNPADDGMEVDWFERGSLTGKAPRSMTGSSEIDFGGRMNALHGALLEEASSYMSSFAAAGGGGGGVGVPGWGNDGADDGSTPVVGSTGSLFHNNSSIVSTSAVFSEQKLFPSNATCEGNRHITDKLL